MTRLGPEFVAIACSVANSSVPCIPEPAAAFGANFPFPMGEIFAPGETLAPLDGEPLGADLETGLDGAFIFKGALARLVDAALGLAVWALARPFPGLADFLLALTFPPMGTDRLPLILWADLRLLDLADRLDPRAEDFLAMEDLPSRWMAESCRRGAS